MKTNIIKKHTEEYIHIKKVSLKTIGLFLLGLVFLTLSYFNLKLIIYKWKLLGLDILFNCKESCKNFANLMQLDICNNLIIEFVLVLTTIILIFNLYNKINWNNFFRGLIAGLILGLITGLIAGLGLGLID